MTLTHQVVQKVLELSVIQTLGFLRTDSVGIGVRSALYTVDGIRLVSLTALPRK